MTEYIDKQALLANLEERQAYLVKEWGPRDHYTRGFEEAVDRVKKIPTADVVPVRHGRWIDGEDDYGSYVTCSICKDEFTNWEADCAYTNYCPNCGARMDGGDENS